MNRIYRNINNCKFVKIQKILIREFKVHSFILCQNIIVSFSPTPHLFNQEKVDHINAYNQISLFLFSLPNFQKMHQFYIYTNIHSHIHIYYFFRFALYLYPTINKNISSKYLFLSYSTSF